MEQIKEVFKKSKVKKIVYVLGCIFVGLLIFQAGMFVGFKKAGFAFRNGEKYFREISGKSDDQFTGFSRSDFTNSHGSIGKIISINLPYITLADKDGTEKTILISTSTNIRKFRDSIKAEDLKVNDFVVVIGDSDEGTPDVEAMLIRVVPSPIMMPFTQIGTGTQIIK